MNPEIAKVLKRLHYPLEVMLTCVRWYVAYPLSLRHLEQMMAERGISVDHSTVHRWALKLLPALNRIFRRHKRPVGKSWRMDETYILVRGQWKYLYRAVDKAGHTIDFLLCAKRDKAAARRFFERAIAQHGQPDTVTIDGSPANLAALHDLNAGQETPIAVRQVKYLNNVVEQDHRAIKRLTRPMLGFKDFRCARILLGGIELMHMIAKGQMQSPQGSNPSAAEQFYSLAA
ncbi:IS6 family transposase [Cupriavidus sp. BIC8F]|uniref:IS6 family transposase n=1 Tax=Cupriavidus sp. BIC8F TaxID=3079014 RepID=UPI0029167583|nr:IS6 family transposase [Cupriavidus sp. BIC8F]